MMLDFWIFLRIEAAGILLGLTILGIEANIGIANPIALRIGLIKRERRIGDTFNMGHAAVVVHVGSAIDLSHFPTDLNLKVLGTPQLCLLHYGMS